MNPREFLREPGFGTALLVTWSIDPVFFETVHLAHLRRGGSTRVVVLADQHQLDARRDQLTRLVRAGRLRHLGRSYSVESVAAPSHFHPKVWIRAGTDGALVLVGSGNLTAHGWGGQWELTTAWRVGPKEEDQGAWLRPLLEEVRQWVAGAAAREAIDRVLALEWLNAPEAALSPILWSSTLSLSAQLERRWAGRRFKTLTMLTGSTDTAGAMLRWAHDAFGVEEATVILSPDRASFDAQRLASLPLRVRVAPFDGDNRPLHAKLAWFEGPDGQAAVMGSANCSASAWLPQSGGPPNVEAVAVYDEPNPPDFEELLADRLAAVRPEDILKPPTSSSAPARPSPAHVRVRSAEWDSLRGVVRLEVGSQGPFELVYEGKAHALVAEDGAWTCSLRPETWPALIELRGPTGASTVQWLDDHRELVFGHRNRRWEGALAGLGDIATPAQHRQIYRDLTRLTVELFDRPKPRKGPMRGPRGPVTEAPPLDPRMLAHARAQQANGTSVPHLFRSTTSLAGIYAAVFDLGDQDGDKGPERSTTESRASVSLPADVIRGLERSMKRHASQMRDARWLRECSPEQMFQALMVPLALTLLGRSAGWLEKRPDLAREWVGDSVDLLLPRTPFASALHRRARLEPEVFGDGRLLASARVAVSVTPWADRLRRALRLRRLDECKPLRAAAQQATVPWLLGAVRVSPEDEAVRDHAFEDLAELLRVEDWLAAKSEALGELQRGAEWFRVGELGWLRGTGRWVRVNVESRVAKNETYVTYLSGDPPVSGRTDQGSRCAIWKSDGGPILLNLHALRRLGVGLPRTALLDLSERPPGRDERRGASLTW